MSTTANNLLSECRIAAFIYGLRLIVETAEATGKPISDKIVRGAKNPLHDANALCKFVLEKGDQIYNLNCK